MAPATTLPRRCTAAERAKELCVDGGIIIGLDMIIMMDDWRQPSRVEPEPDASLSEWVVASSNVIPWCAFPRDRTVQIR